MVKTFVQRLTQDEPVQVCTFETSRLIIKNENNHVWNLGELTAQCVGPTKIAFCELVDQNDGTFSLLIKAQETGKHTLIVKYNDEHVSGLLFSHYQLLLWPFDDRY